MTRVLAAIGLAVAVAGCQPLSPTPPFHFVETPDALARGRVAAALMAKASDLLSLPPTIEKVDVLAAKLPA